MAKLLRGTQVEIDPKGWISLKGGLPPNQQLDAWIWWLFVERL